MSATAVHLEGGKKLKSIMQSCWQSMPATLEGGGRCHLALSLVKRHHAQSHFSSRRQKVVRWRTHLLADIFPELTTCIAAVCDANPVNTRNMKWGMKVINRNLEKCTICIDKD